MMNRGLMKRQMFAMGGPVRMQQGGLAGISRSLQGANESLGNAQQQLQIALGSNGGMGSPMGGIMGLQAPQQRGLPSGFADMVGNPMGKIGAIQNRLQAPDQVAAPIGMEEGGAAGFGSLQAEADRLGITVAELLSRMQSDNRRMSVFEMEKMQKFRDRLREEMDRPSPPTAQGLPQRPIKLKEGGAAGFPDLTGDGQVTQADILKGRGVQMQMGGEPMMAQQAAMMQAPMPQAPMPQDPSMDQAMAQAAQVGMDPAAVEGMLSQVSEGIGNLDDAEDFEQVMNSMRGDEAPISERYAELAEVVGEEDAEATPESVLALVQPVMQMAQVDQGIGGLAQEEMSAPVEGNMAGGIMSTVNMGEEVPAPVNFNQGGPVVAMAPGGVVERATALQPGFQKMFGNILGTQEDRQAEFDEQKKLTQAQMLFDIANTALAFATPGEKQMSPAERLAAVTQETQLFDKIGARSQSLQDLKTKQKEAQRQLDLAATQSALSEASSQARAQEAIDLARAKQTPEYTTETVKTADGIKVIVTDKTTGTSRVTQTFKTPDPEDKFTTEVIETGDKKIKVLVTNTTTGETEVKETFTAPKDKGTFRVQQIEAADGIHLVAINDVTAEKKLIQKFKAPSKDKFTTTSVETKDGIQFVTTNTTTGKVEKSLLFDAPDDATYSLTQVETDDGIKLLVTNNKTGTVKETQTYQPPKGDVKGVPHYIWKDLTEDEQDIVLNLVPVVADKYSLEEIETAEGTKLFIFNEADGSRELAETFDPVATGSLVKFRITNPDGTVDEAVELLNSKAGKELQKRVNEAKKKDPQSASIVKVGTEQVNPQAYLTKDGDVITSFDNRTFFNPKTNKVMSLSDPTVQAQALGDANVYEIIKSQNIQNYAQKRIENRMKEFEGFTFIDKDENPLSAEKSAEVRNFIQEQLKTMYVSEKDVKKGTGVISNLFAALNVVGGTFLPKTFNTIFKDTNEARKAIELFNLAAVSALARNPRLAVYDMQRVERVLISPTTLFANVETEADKFQDLIALMQQERNSLEEGLRRGDKSLMDDVGKTMTKLKEIDFVLSLVRIEGDGGSKSLADALGQSESLFE